MIDDPLWGKIKCVDAEKLQELLKEIKPMDLVPVIYCKCWNPLWKSCSEYDDAMMPQEHFCSYAERKEE